MTAPLEVGLCVGDLDHLARFYVDGVGCTEVFRAAIPPALSGPVGLGLDGVEVAWLETPWGERLKLLSPQEPAQPPARRSHLASVRGWAYLTFFVDDLEGTCRRMVEAGATVLSASNPVDAGPAGRIVFLADPEGNGLELVERAEA